MKKHWNYFFSAILLSLGLLVVGCQQDFQSADLPLQIEDISAEQSNREIIEVREYGVEIIENQQDPNLADIEVFVTESGEEVLSLTLDGFDASQYIEAEYEGDHLYLKKEFGSDENPTDELWRFDQFGEGESIYQSRSFTFDVSPTEQMIAVMEWNVDYEDPEVILFIDQEGLVISEQIPDEVLPLDVLDMMVDLEGWSSDGTIFWGTHSVTWVPLYIFSIDVSTWDITTFQVPDQSINIDYDYNPDSQKLVFSDCPTFIDMSGYTWYVIEQTPVKLSIFDYQNNTQESLAVSVALCFNPKWITNDLIAYDDPVGRGRIIFDTRDGSTILEPGEPDEILQVYPDEIPPEFDSVIDVLRQTTADIMLPASFPVQEGSPVVYPKISTSRRGTYWISLSVGEDCESGNNCYYGKIGVRTIGAGGGSEASIMPFWGREQYMYVRLSQNISGYFVQPSCSSCGNAALYWIYNNTEYMLVVTGAGKDALVTISNMMIDNSVPPLDG